jgi:hypothetical protein
MLRSDAMSTRTPTAPEMPDQDEREHDLSPEEEDELIRRCEDAIREDAELIPHEALFPRRRAAG